MSRLPAFALVFMLAACGGGSPSDPLDSSCTTTVSGAVSGTVTKACIPSGFVSSGIAGFGLSVSDPSFGAIDFSAQFKGQTFATGTYDASSLALSATTDTYPANSQTDWNEESGAAAAGNPVGSVTLVISSTGTQDNGTGATVWVGSHGTIDATLPGDTSTSATGSVTLHISF